MRHMVINQNQGNLAIQKKALLIDVHRSKDAFLVSIHLQLPIKKDHIKIGQLCSNHYHPNAHHPMPFKIPSIHGGCSSL